MTKLMEGIEIMLDSEPFYWCDYKASGELVNKENSVSPNNSFPVDV